MKDNTLFTGGAIGADHEFVIRALRADHAVIVLSFQGHRDSLPQKKEGQELHIDRIDHNKLRSADTYLERARVKLGRSKGVGYVNKLLLRNWFQVQRVSSVYAVGDFAYEKASKQSVRIAGGTAWACQMFADRQVGLGEMADKAIMIPLYFFSQEENSWFQCQKTNADIEWNKITVPPRPEKEYTGIGSRDLTVNGRAAIAALFA